MKRAAITLFAPPFAICRYGCASCCAAPVAVFWLTAIVGIAYGFTGGPARLMGPSWSTIGLGVALWAIAALWAAVAIRSSADRPCRDKESTLCNRLVPGSDESDPFDEVRKAR